MKLRTQTPEKPRSSVRNSLIAVAIITLFAAGYSFPNVYNSFSDLVHQKAGFSIGHLSTPSFKLGLDLRGGAHLMYDVDTSSVTDAEKASAVAGARDVIERRVNAFGVGEPVVQTTKVGDIWRVLVELPDVHDVKAAIDQIGATPTLEFRDQSGDGSLTPEEQKVMADTNAAAKDSAMIAQKEARARVAFADLYKKYNGKDLGFVSAVTQPELFAWGSRNRQGAVSDAIETKDAYYIMERGADKKQPLAEARHILICWDGSDACESKITKEEAEQKIKELMLKVTPQNFADLAKVNSNEPAAATTGGALGEIRPGDLVKPFEDALFSMRVGEIKGPVETSFGYHIIYKTAQKDESFVGARVLEFAKKTPEDFALAGGWRATGLSGKQLSRATVEFDQKTGEPNVNLQFNDDGKALFAEITERNIGKEVGIFLDGQMISAPTVRQSITDGRAVISGGFTVSDAKKLAERLNAGALPLPIKLVGQQTVGATLGAQSLADSARAGVIGFIFVLIFLTAFYRLPGFVASLALLVYVAVVLAVFKFIPVTLTLAGIAGFILSMGMAVDANVLVFERTREELKDGRSPSAALEEAFPRAWNSIRDSNASSLITCVILYWFGSSVVKGFALTLAIGIIASLFSAITVTRLVLRAIAPYLKNKPALFVQPKKS